MLFMDVDSSKSPFNNGSDKINKELLFNKLEKINNANDVLKIEDEEKDEEKTNNKPESKKKLVLNNSMDKKYNSIFEQVLGGLIIKASNNNEEIKIKRITTRNVNKRGAKRNTQRIRQTYSIKFGSNKSSHNPMKQSEQEENMKHNFILERDIEDI